MSWWVFLVAILPCLSVSVCNFVTFGARFFYFSIVVCLCSCLLGAIYRSAGATSFSSFATLDVCAWPWVEWGLCVGVLSFLDVFLFRLEFGLWGYVGGGLLVGFSRVCIVVFNGKTIGCRGFAYEEQTFFNANFDRSV